MPLHRRAIKVGVTKLLHRLGFTYKKPKVVPGKADRVKQEEFLRTTYSLNLNLIERLWRFFHQKVTYNRYSETIEEFRRETLNFFRNLHYYEPELKTLLSDNFQLVLNLNLQT